MFFTIAHQNKKVPAIRMSTVIKEGDREINQYSAARISAAVISLDNKHAGVIYLDHKHVGVISLDSEHAGVIYLDSFSKTLAMLHCPLVEWYR